MLKVNKLTKSYQNEMVLKDCSFDLKEGIYGLLGRNGAGKTTLLKAILNLIQVDSGWVSILKRGSIAEDINLLRDIGVTIETPKHYLHLTAKDNLSIHLSYLNYPIEKQNKMILKSLKKVGLEKEMNKCVSDFSLGMKQRLAIARAIIHQPKILILDEPLNGLDPIAIKEMRELFLTLSEENKMVILFSSHILQEVLMVSDYILVLNNGELVFNEAASALNVESPEKQLVELMEER